MTPDWFRAMTPDWFRKLAAATAEAWKNVAPEIDELAKDAGMDEAARHQARASRQAKHSCDGRRDPALHHLPAREGRWPGRRSRHSRRVIAVVVHPEIALPATGHGFAAGCAGNQRP